MFISLIEVLKFTYVKRNKYTKIRFPLLACKGTISFWISKIPTCRDAIYCVSWGVYNLFSAYRQNVLFLRFGTKNGAF